MSRTFDYPGLRILEAFFDDPHSEVYLREVAARVGVSPSTAKRFLDDYTKIGLLAETRKANLHLFKANLEEPAFRLWKTSHLLLKSRPYLSRLAQLYPDSSLTLFGSCAQGTDGPGSDMDLLLVTRSTSPLPAKLLSDLSKHVEREAQVLRYTPEDWDAKAREDKPFYERVIIDGIALSGNLPVVAT